MGEHTPNPSHSSRNRQPRSGTKRDQIVRSLRRQIVEGAYPAGSQLPVRTAMEKQFQASPLTVQRALDYLAKEGFVEARGRHGTYVVDHPPHLSHYALIFPRRPEHPDWNRFWTALSNEARQSEQAGPRRIQIYHIPETDASGPETRMLLADLEHDRLAGLIFPFYPGFLDGTPLLTLPDVPRVAVCENASPGMSVVTFPSRRLADKALDYFARRGRRRIAVFSLHGFAETNGRYVASAIEKRGMITRPYWLLSMTHRPEKAVENCAHLLMHGNQSERPDALLIADDNLIEPATMGLTAAGVRGTEDLEIVAHCNFPWPSPSHLPVRYVGYDVRELLRHSIEAIDRQRHGDFQPLTVHVDPLFENEFASATPNEPVAS